MPLPAVPFLLPSLRLFLFWMQPGQYFQQSDRHVWMDIQAKLQAGKGAGYARWAKVFNLKQMAQTMNYLSENNLLEYAVLEEKAAAATAHHNELSAHIKAAEKRMAEIAVLRTHIVNYAKTREVYVAYPSWLPGPSTCASQP